jgi:hypothetical protein
MTRCKFVCTSKREYQGWGGHARLYEYEFNAVTGGSDDNQKFFAATPAGSLKVSTVTDGTFEVGKEYFLDLHVAS